MLEILKQACKRVLADLSHNPLVRHYYQGQGVIFTLHRVVDTQEKLPKSIGVSTAFLDTFLALLKDKGFSFVDMDEICDLLQKGKPFAKIVHWTLDDGFQCALDHALPIFKAHNAPFTTYICTDLIDCIEADSLDWSDGLEMLDWEGVKALHAEPLCTIGGHTKSHPKLSQLPTRESVLEQIQKGNAILQTHLEQKIRHFAYPYGRVGTAGLREVEVVQELGLKSAVTTRRGTLYPEHKDFLICLPRVMLEDGFKLHEIWRLRKHRIATL
ncbi:polysaccharide deacetylase family protein [Helicobacter bizzozeronii]|uniref:polysaccharide deacetylase family protein n=1 Tax=Helicobacter bizzozeronii TaxID=56877 RepID=UPI000CEDEEEE|nr:polysaccharide deacetylase family protein [Helicobacter bizzozeronii]